MKEVKNRRNSEGRSRGEGIDKLFRELNQYATLYKAPGMPTPCYQWNCTKEEYQADNRECRWCLPYAIIPGMPKSGTSELFALLDLHPNIQGWRLKEMNIFSQFEFTSLADFEVKVSAYLVAPNMASETTWWVDPYSYWVDGSAICAHHTSCLNALTKYSPHTKSILMVRDPFQRLASFLCMIHQDYLKKNDLLNRTSEKFIEWLSDAAFRATDEFTADFDNIRTIFYIYEVNQRMMDVMVVDNYDLLFNREDTMLRIESFLGVQPFDNFGNISGVNSFGDWSSELSTLKTRKQPFIYRYSHNTTSKLESLFQDFLCTYKEIVGRDLHLVTPGLLLSLLHSCFDRFIQHQSTSSHWFKKIQNNPTIWIISQEIQEDIPMIIHSHLLA